MRSSSQVCHSTSNLDFVVPWACAATLVSELGFPCYVSRTRYVQAFWPDED